MMEVLRKCLLWLYCLDISEAVFWMLAVTAAFLWLHGKLAGKQWWHCVLGGTFVCWVAVTLYTTLGNRDGSLQAVSHFRPFHSYLEVMNGGNRELLRSNFMNMALFYPGGLLGAGLLPVKRRRWLRCLAVVLVLTLMSIAIEWLQYRFALGRCETDDVIHNMFGALLGSLLVGCVKRPAEK